MDYEKSVFLSDVHIPYEDKRAVIIALNFVKWFKPQFVFLVGDILDFYQLSRFDKDPERALSLQDDINETKAFLAHLRLVAPRAKIVFIEGNHERRLTKYLWSHPEISGLDAVKLPAMLDFKRYNIQFVTMEEELEHHGFLIEHGHIVRKHSGYTARGMMEARGCSGLSGHTHRGGMHYMTNMGGDFVWVENGCLCDRNPQYVKRPNWQNLFSVGYFKVGKQRFHVEQVCITDGKAVYAGREFI